MRYSPKRLWIVFGAVVLSQTLPVPAAVSSPESLTRGISYEQRLGGRVSPDLTFTDDQGQKVKLANYFRGRPVVLELGYYRCPRLCGVSLNAAERTLDEFPPASPSRDFEFVFVSVDPADRYLAAAVKKAECLRRLRWEPATDRWHFLTGGDAAAQLAGEVGFHYRFDPQSKQYIHPSGMVIVSPEGVITSYLLGIDYPAGEFERALASARHSQPGVIGDIISVLCFSHDPVAGSAGYYVLIALRCGAILTVIGVIALIRHKRQPLDGRRMAA